MRTIILLACLFTASVSAQPGIAGKWAVTAKAVSAVTDSGGSWSRAALTGRLDIEQSGATLKGSWTSPKGEPWPFTGRLTDDAFELTTMARDVPVTRDGQQTTAKFRWVFRGTIAGDMLRGSLQFDRDGETSERLQPFTAQREK